MQVARQHPRGVGDRLAAAELELVGAQRQRVGPELGDPDAERDPGPGRGAFEVQGHGLARERLAAHAAVAARLELGGSGEQGLELDAGELLAGEEMPRDPLQAGHSMRRVPRSPRPELEPLPRPRSPARSGPVHAALPAAAAHRGQRHASAGQPRPLLRVRRDAGRGRVGRRPAAGVSAAVGRAAGAGDRRRGARRAHLAQLVGRDPLDAGAPQSRPDRLQRGRLQPHPGPRRGARAA